MAQLLDLSTLVYTGERYTTIYSNIDPAEQTRIVIQSSSVTDTLESGVAFEGHFPRTVTTAH